MFPAANASSVFAKPVQPAPTQTAQKTSQSQAPETARTSAGESSAANIKAETSQAIQAPEQSSVVARLRDQEKSESTDRAAQVKERPAGPPPSFKETPLERRARVALEPPEVPEVPDETDAALESAVADDAPNLELVDDAISESQPAVVSDPPLTRTEKAEASFSETRSLSEPKDPATVDLRN
ncbi:hypothetical protein N9L47_11675 [Rhodobacteraceae bacterium]|nr:hypothetical protein [Paracoccaceae bacterium]